MTWRSASCASCVAGREQRCQLGNYDRRVALPLKPPVKPQLALSRKALPEGEEWCYEPKYDGFRALAFVDGDDVFLQSRNGRPLSRYFPELRFPKGQYVIDGELVILGDDGLETFDALQNRIHPAESRINMLAEETPARYRAFDLLAVGKRKALKDPFEARREALKTLVEEAKDPGSVELTPLVGDPAEAEPWLATGEGVIAKQIDAPYRPGERKGMVKVKRLRTADCVVVGWRHGKEEGTVGSLILGLYDGKQLRVVGHTSGLKAKEKRELVDKLAPYATGEKGSADPSRWAADRELEWVGLRPELVVEVSFDHVAAGRIRHGSKLLRWREDKDPKDCLYSQLDQ
jgi:ATP-dependent DNA ligase